jgi:hypothetical protein
MWNRSWPHYVRGVFADERVSALTERNRVGEVTLKTAIRARARDKRHLRRPATTSLLDQKRVSLAPRCGRKAKGGGLENDSLISDLFSLFRPHKFPVRTLAAIRQKCARMIERQDFLAAHEALRDDSRQIFMRCLRYDRSVVSAAKRSDAAICREGDASGKNAGGNSGRGNRNPT